MKVRELKPEDAAAYFEVRLEGLREEPRAFGRSAEEFASETLESVARRLAGTADVFTLGAFEDDRLLGIMTFARQSGSKVRHKANVFGVYVRREGRGRGVGAQLLTALVARARETAGVEQLLLAVSTTQGAARRLYERLGFEAFGVEPRALKVGGEDVDEVHMWLDLREAPSS